MGLLQTWDQYSTYVDANGKYRVIWQWPDGNIEFHKFPAFLTEPELEIEFANIAIEREYGGIYQEIIFLEESNREYMMDGTFKILYKIPDELLLKEVIIYIRSHPTITLNQWNTYLNTKPYEQRAIIKMFIHRLALKLAEHYGLILSNYTETEILQKTRNWICTVNINILKKVVFGYFIEL